MRYRRSLSHHQKIYDCHHIRRRRHRRRCRRCRRRRPNVSKWTAQTHNGLDEFNACIALYTALVPSALLQARTRLSASCARESLSYNTWCCCCSFRIFSFSICFSYKSETIETTLSKTTTTTSTTTTSTTARSHEIQQQNIDLADCWSFTECFV